MLKKLSLTILVAFLIASYTTVAFGEELELQLRTTSHSYVVGEDIEIDIILINALDIAGGEIILNYDKEKVEYNSKTINLDTDTYIDLQNHGSALGDSTYNTKLIFGLKKDSALLNNTEITLGTITYKALEEGEVHFNLDNESRLVKYDDANGYIYEAITLPDEGTVINIYTMGAISGTIALDDGFSPQGATVTLLIEGEEIQTITATEDGSYSFIGLEDGLYTVRVTLLGYQPNEAIVEIAQGSKESLDIALTRIKEDVNRDGVIDLEDLVEVGNLFKLSHGDSEFNSDADVNNDNVIDLLDLINITREIQ